MSCCNRPPAGRGPNSNEIGTMLKGLGVFLAFILVLAYFFG
jgi:flagellar biogenesis protein FliO